MSNKYCEHFRAYTITPQRGRCFSLVHLGTFFNTYCSCINHGLRHAAEQARQQGALTRQEVHTLAVAQGHNLTFSIRTAVSGLPIGIVFDIYEVCMYSGSLVDMYSGWPTTPPSRLWVRATFQVKLEGSGQMGSSRHHNRVASGNFIARATLFPYTMYRVLSILR